MSFATLQTNAPPVQAQLARGLCLWLVVVSALQLGIPAACAATTARTWRFAIPREEAVEALHDFSTQSGVQTLSPSEDLRGLSLGPLAGEFTVTEALERLLQGSGLSARRDPSGIYLIARTKPPAGPRQAPRQPGADTTPPPVVAAAVPVETVTITGSYIRRTNLETPSPVQTITAGEIEQRNVVSLADAVRALPADNSGTLPQAFSGAIAGGASAVSLRGMTVDATLVLVDGHRMAPYPLADDGQRPFVDLASLPLSLVDRVEILKDGASSVYGSDAIAGVVNILLKKTFTGLDTAVGAGISTRGDGIQERMAFTYGFGDLVDDGYNTYINVEYRHQDAIGQNSRGSYLDNLDLRNRGGSDLRQGIVLQPAPNNFAFTTPGMVAPLSNGSQVGSFYLLPGCAAQDRNYSGGCTWDASAYRQIQPRTAGVTLTVKHSQRLDDEWQASLTASLFDSRAEQVNNPPTHVPNTWVGAASGQLVDQRNPATTPILLGPSHPDNPFNPASPYYAAAAAYYGAAFGQFAHNPALLYLSLTDLGPQHSFYRTDVARVVADLTGSAGEWDLTGALGYVKAATRITYRGFVRASALSAALANNTYRIGANSYLNSASLNAQLAPETSDTATSSLAFLSMNATRPLLALAGGPLRVALGAEFHYLTANNPGQPYAIAGDIINAGGSYARGTQAVSAGHLELSAPITSALELDAAGRVDYYNDSGTSLTPKVGFKWSLLPALALRATYARGFRAPGPAENGDGSTGTVTTAPIDPLRCPFTRLPTDCGQTTVAVLSRTNPSLRPETSQSYTVGAAWTAAGHHLSLDYFHIQRDNEIIAQPLGQATPVRGAQQPGTSFPGPIIYYDDPYQNASSSQTAGFDADGQFQQSFGSAGALTLGAASTWLLRSRQEVAGAVYNFAGTAGPTAVGAAVGTPRTRATFKLEWEKRDFSLGSFVNYHSAVKAVDESTSGPGVCLQLWAGNPHCYVASFTTADFFARYSLSSQLQLTVTLNNAFNRLAPLDTATYGGQNYNPSLDQAGAVGRYLSLQLHYRR
ncbi:MAG: TonB-dependent receptor [Proteobacteria bacterium]|nr:TonB-dependent receptor [Pseudomonadota bacterium]